MQVKTHHPKHWESLKVLLKLIISFNCLRFVTLKFILVFHCK